MSKADWPFQRIDLSRVFRAPGKPAYVGEMPINGYDTETSGHNVVILSVAFEGESGFSVHNDCAPVEPAEVFRYLTHKKARSSLNVWYNLDFDANVILSHLPATVLYELTVFGTAKWDQYEITYLPGKLLTIRDGSKHKYQHFDVSQFFFGGLDKACREWLGVGKANENVDVKRFEDSEYLREHWAEIIRYADVDAERVRDLWREFANVAEPLEIPCGRPYSTGYLAEQTYNVKFRQTQKPSFESRSLQELAWASYRGGRFEVIERGAVAEPVTTLDINSAYPHVLRTLPDPGTLRWRLVRNPSWPALESADYGFVEAIVSTDANRPIQPFAIRAGGSLKFPALDLRTVSVTLPEFLYGVRSGLVADFHVTRAWLGQKDSQTVFPYRWVSDLYDKRKEFQRDGDHLKQLVLKIIINSLYGKLAQLTEITEQTPDGADWQPHWLWYPTDLYPPEVRKHLEAESIELHRMVRAGTYYNPFVASYVTGLTRLKLIQSAIDCGLESDVILLATDSITIRQSAYERSDFRKFEGPALGQWEPEGSGHIFVVGSGVYEMTQPDGSLKSRTRGFEPGFGVYGMDLGGASLRDAAAAETYDAERKRWVIPISNKRPVKIAQAIWQGFDMNDVGVFKEFPRGLAAGMDSKRDWPRGSGVSWKELTEKSERSKPLRADDSGLTV